VAFVYDGSTHAVMMASPADLEDFALGFSLTEGIIAGPEEIERLEVVGQAAGIELRMWLAPGRGRVLAERRRRLAGPTGCGLCGIESLEEAARPVRRVGPGMAVAPEAVTAAVAALAPAQALNRATHAVHAAGFWHPDRGLLAIREDVGRHNALDKLAGALWRAEAAAETGILLLTSRLSVEMVQKAAAIGAPLVVAVSAPTALAVRTAEAAGITLVAVARGDGFEVFAHPERIRLPANVG
jgi:FdhD protein